MTVVASFILGRKGSDMTDGAPRDVPDITPSNMPDAASSKKTLDQRKELLGRAIQGPIASGYRIESQSDFQAVLVTGHRVNHLLHFFIGLFTLGIWWLAWIVIAIVGGEERQMVLVDEFGNVSVQRT